MAINYYVQARESSFGNVRKRRYYLIAKSNGRISRKDLIEYMTRNASLTQSEANSALDYLLEAIPYFLKLGKRIDLDDLGSITAAIRSEGSDDPKEATPDKVRGIYMHFNPDRKLKLLLQRIPLEKLEKRVRSPHKRLVSHRQLQEVEERQKELIARKAIAEELPVEMISKLTGLSEEAVEALRCCG